MKNFQYAAARDARQAITLLSDDWDAARVMAGGTDLLDEMKERLVSPARIVHLQGAPLSYVKFASVKTGPMKTATGHITIGATTTITTLATHPTIRERLPGLSQAAGSIATPQIRNTATLGGNLCQRPRCWYYRNQEYPCLKKGGSTCYAKDGANKYNAILGGGPSYIVHPSDCAPMLLALGASVRIAGPRGERLVPLDKFFTLPKTNIARENILEPNEIVTEILVPTPPVGSRSVYHKIKERDTQDFALASCAVALTVKDGAVSSSRIVLGGVAPIPWRAPEAEAVVRGKKITPQLAQAAAQAALQKARPLADNAYKITVAQTALRRALLAAVA